MGRRRRLIKGKVKAGKIIKQRFEQWVGAEKDYVALMVFFKMIHVDKKLLSGAVILFSPLANTVLHLFHQPENVTIRVLGFTSSLTLRKPLT